MFARLATTLAVGRRHSWRSGAIHEHRDEARRIVSAPERPVLLCRWTVDPTSGRPVCAWEAEKADATAAIDAPQTRSRTVLVLAASRGEPGRHDASRRPQAEPRRTAPQRRPALVIPR